MMNSSAPVSSPHKQVAVSISSSGDNTVIAALSGRNTQIFRIAITAASPVDVNVKDGSTSLGLYRGLGSLVLEDPTGLPVFVSAGNFILNLSSAVSVSGTVWYTQG